MPLRIMIEVFDGEGRRKREALLNMYVTCHIKPLAWQWGYLDPVSKLPCPTQLPDHHALRCRVSTISLFVQIQRAQHCFLGYHYSIMLLSSVPKRRASIMQISSLLRGRPSLCASLRAAPCTSLFVATRCRRPQHSNHALPFRFEPERRKHWRPRSRPASAQR